jgi:hypothetical protein
MLETDALTVGLELLFSFGSFVSVFLIKTKDEKFVEAKET